MCWWLQTLNLNRKVKTTSYTVEDLEPDVEYEFRVSAENNIGTSEPAVSNPLKYGQSHKLQFCTGTLNHVLASSRERRSPS